MTQAWRHDRVIGSNGDDPYAGRIDPDGAAAIRSLAVRSIGNFGRSIIQFIVDRSDHRWQDGGRMDAPRKLLVDTLARRSDLDLKNLSLAIGRNDDYLQQYLMRGSPRELPESVRH